MSPEKAYALDISSADMRVWCQLGLFNDEWVVTVPNVDRPGDRVVWQGSVFGACRFAAEVERLERSCAKKLDPAELQW